jgi:hypothetical protein
MKILQIPFLSKIRADVSLELASEILEDNIIEFQAIDCINWPIAFPSKPDVLFKLTRIENGLLLKFYVKEDFTRATYTFDNQPVYKDSCVEFFIDPSGDGTYYNFEFNAIGTLSLGFGVNRHNREEASFEITKSVKRLSSLGLHPIENKSDGIPWQLTVMIPYTSFWHHPALTLNSKRVKGNLQKCGDELPVAHYLTWSPINTPMPDYHRQEFFGTFDFE